MNRISKLLCLLFFEVLLISSAGCSGEKADSNKKIGEGPLRDKTKELRVSGRLLAKWDLKAQVRDRIAFSPDGKFVTCAGARDLQIWRAEDGKPHRVLSPIPIQDQDGGVVAVKWMPHGKQIAAQVYSMPDLLLWKQAKAELLFWDLGNGKKTSQEFDAQESTESDLSPDGKILASAFKHLRILEVKSGKLLHEFSFAEGTGKVDRIRFSRNGRWLGVIASFGGPRVAEGPYLPRIHVWDTTTWKKVFTAWEGGVQVFSIAFSPDESVIAAMGSTDPGEVRIWDLSTKKLVRTIEADPQIGYGVEFALDGRILVSTGLAPEVQLWDWKKGALAGTLTGHPGSACGIGCSDDGKTVAVGAFNKQLLLWRLDQD